MKLRNTLISIPAQGAWLDGLLAHAPDVRGLAILPQSSGHPALDSGPRPVDVALQSRGFATLRVDLLTRQVLAVVLPSLKAQPALLSLMASGLNGFVMQLMVRWVLTDYQDREEDILRVCSLAFIGTYEHLRQLPEL